MATLLTLPDQTPMSSETTPTCINCQQYLSVAPIFINSEGYWCGRCNSILNTKRNLFGSTYHLTAYESIAKNIQFPCQYDVFGCKELIKFESVKTHEMKCQFRTDKCPIIDCGFRVAADTLLEHCLMYHEKIVLNPLEFSLSIDEDIQRNYVIHLSFKTYVLSISTSLKDKKIWLNVCNFDFRDVLEKSTYFLEVKRKSTKSMVVNEQRIKEYDPVKSFFHGDMLSLDYKQLLSVLKGNDLVFSIRLEDCAVATELGILEELECIVCQDYMRAPIYICTTGHSICSNCKILVANCPLCKSPFGGARNFALEKLSEKTKLPSKDKISNHGRELSSSARPPSIKQKSSQQIFKCPLEISEKCQWIGQARDIFVHSGEKHPTKIFGSKLIFQRNTKRKNTVENSVMFFDHNTFKLFIKYHDNRGPLHLTVSHIELSASGNPQYRFIVDFHDPTKKGKTLTIGCLCYSARRCQQQQKDSIPFVSLNLPFDFLDSFVSKDHIITCTIEVKKVFTA